MDPTRIRLVGLVASCLLASAAAGQTVRRVRGQQSWLDPVAEYNREAKEELRQRLHAPMSGTPSGSPGASSPRAEEVQAGSGNAPRPPSAPRGQPLPKPRVALVGTEEYQVRGKTFTRYQLAVENHGDYDEALFQPAPDLPPCGLNESASRTWVDILEGSGRRLYGFCALGSAAGLGRLWFAVPRGGQPPGQVKVRLLDRRTKRDAVSDPVPLRPPVGAGARSLR